MKIVPKVPGSSQCSLTVLSPEEHLRSSVNLSKYWQIFTTLAPKLSIKREKGKGERGKGEELFKISKNV
jgi:hypothetical protein